MTAAPQMTEQQLQDAIVDLAHLAGWKVFHVRPGRTSGSWRTAVSYDGKGYPDLTLVHERSGRLIFAEIKTDRGKPSPAQEAWLRALERTAAEVYVWTSADWSVPITEILLGLTARESAA